MKATFCLLLAWAAANAAPPSNSKLQLLFADDFDGAALAGKWNYTRGSLERPRLLFREDGKPEALLAAVDEEPARRHSYNVQIPLRSY